MALLTQQIPPQNFELIRDRIASILTDEIANQINLGASQDINAKVYTERVVPFDAAQMPAINVLLSNGNSNFFTTVDAAYIYTFFVDVHTKAKTTDSKRAYTDSAEKLHKILGVCRAILETPVYRTLAFAAPSIEHTAVTDINIADPKNNQDGNSTMMGRLTFTVRVRENVELIEAQPIDGFNTAVKLYDTEQGYFWSSGDYAPLNLDPLHIWDSEHLTNIGVSKLDDFNQQDPPVAYPLFTAFGSFAVLFVPPTIAPYFGGYPSLSFNGSGAGSVVTTNVVDFRGGDSKGKFLAVIRTPNAWNPNGDHLISTSNTGTDTHYSTFYVDNGVLKFDIHDGTTLQSISATTTSLSPGSEYVVLVESVGSSYKMNINGVDQAISGPNNGKWMNGIAAGRNALSIGGVNKSTWLIYGGEAAVFGYFADDVDSGDLISVTNAKYDIF